jgi:hypothetical protein
MSRSVCRERISKVANRPAGGKGPGVIASAAGCGVQAIQKLGSFFARQALLVKAELQSQLVDVRGRVEGLEIKG